MLERRCHGSNCECLEYLVQWDSQFMGQPHNAGEQNDMSVLTYVVYIHLYIFVVMCRLNSSCSSRRAWVHVEFVNELRTLYETGEAPGCKISHHIVGKFVRAIGSLEAAHTLKDIWANKGFNFEKVDDIYSIRLNDQWRLELTIDWVDKQHSRETVYPQHLSKHYKERWP